MVIGIVVILVGLFFVTPFGARIGQRANQRHAGDRFGTPGTRPTSIPGVMLVGVIFIAFGIYLVVQAA